MKKNGFLLNKYIFRRKGEAPSKGKHISKDNDFQKDEINSVTIRNCVAGP